MIRPNASSAKSGLLLPAMLLLVVGGSVAASVLAPAAQRQVQIDSQRSVSEQVCTPWVPTSTATTRESYIAYGSADLNAPDAAVRFAESNQAVPAASVFTRAKDKYPFALRVEGKAATGVSAISYARTVSGVGRGIAAEPCKPPAQDWWFGSISTVAGSSAALVLFNPDSEDVIAKITGYDSNGLIKAGTNHRVLVRAGRSTRIDLAEMFPALDPLAIHVRVAEGRVSASVQLARVNGETALGRSFVNGVNALSTQAVLVGVRVADAGAALTLLSPAEDAVVSVRISTSAGEVALAGAEQITVTANRAIKISLPAKVWDSPGAVIVESSGPILATVSQLVPSLKTDDLNVLSAQPLVATAGITPVPRGLLGERLLAYSESDADVTLSAYRSGKLLWTTVTQVPAHTATTLTMTEPLADGGLLVFTSSEPTAVTHWLFIGDGAKRGSTSVAIAEMSAQVIAGARLELSIS